MPYSLNVIGRSFVVIDTDTGLEKFNCPAATARYFPDYEAESISFGNGENEQLFGGNKFPYTLNGVIQLSEGAPVNLGVPVDFPTFASILTWCRNNLGFSTPAGGSAGISGDNTFAGSNTFTQEITLSGGIDMGADQAITWDANTSISQSGDELNVLGVDMNVFADNYFLVGVNESTIQIIDGYIDIEAGTGGVTTIGVPTVTAAPNVVDEEDPTYLPPGKARLAWNSNLLQLIWYFNRAGNLETNT